MSITKNTRKKAYAEIIPKRSKRKQLILDMLLTSPNGMTAEEIVDALYKENKIPRPDMNYVRPRLTEMKDAGEVRAVSQRKASTGRDTAVWKVAS